jgi:hypothetical protein
MSGAIEEAAKRWLTDPAYQKVHKTQKEFKWILFKDLHFLKASNFLIFILLSSSLESLCGGTFDPKDL